MNDEKKSRKQVFSRRRSEGQKTNSLGAEWIPYSSWMTSMVS